MKHLLIISIALLIIATSCKKKGITSSTQVNGVVRNAVTGEVMPGIKVNLNEDVAGFSFSASTLVETTTTDAYGRFYFDRKTSKPLAVAISSDNKYISAAVVYDEIKTYETNIELGNVNNITLSPAEYGYLSAQIISDGNADSLKLKESYHLTLNPNGYTPSFVTLYNGYQSSASGEKIIGKYIIEYYKYNGGSEIYQKDTVEIFKGQTTTYELHF